MSILTNDLDGQQDYDSKYLHRVNARLSCNSGAMADVRNTLL